MNALHKVAWISFLVPLAALATFFALYPWIGDRAAGAVGILGLLGISPIFMLKRKEAILSDERDREIERRSQLWGFGASWLFLSLSLLWMGMWFSWLGQPVPAKYCIALVYIHFALFYCVKGACSLIYYKSGPSAA